jgi:hypothetical protein
MAEEDDNPGLDALLARKAAIEAEQAAEEKLRADRRAAAKETADASAATAAAAKETADASAAATAAAKETAAATAATAAGARETAAATRDATVAATDAADASAAMAASQRETAAATRDATVASEEGVKARKDLLDILERERDTHKEIRQKAELELIDMEIAKKLGVGRLELAEKRREVQGKIYEDLQQQNKDKLKQDILDAKGDTAAIAAAEKIYYAEQKILLLKQRGNEAQAEGAQSAQDMAARYLGLSKDGGKMFDNLGDKAMGFVSELGEMLTISNIAAAGLTKIVEASIALAIEQDAASVAFNKATGQAGAYNAQIRGLERGMVNAGVSSAEAGQAFTDLFTTVTDFSNMSKSTQTELATTVAMLNELGVSSSESAQSIQFLTKVMGKSTTQAAEQTRELFAFAQELGVSAAGMSADFIKMQPRIAALGDTGVQAFKDLQAQAKATGMSFDSLLAITDKFDTFAGAADQVGKLNAVMGGPFLNTLEMVTATDPAERMRKLSEGINASGLSFDQMSYYQKKAMTSAAGLNSEMELAMLMSGKLEDARGPVKTQADLEDLAAQTAEFNTIFEEMKQFGMSLAISFGPIVGFLKNIVDYLTESGPLLKIVIGALVGMAVAAALVGGAITAVAAGFVAMAIARALFDGGTTMVRGAIIAGAIIGGGVMMMGDAATDDGSTKSGKGYAKGGIVSGIDPPLVMVGERGPEMVTLPKGSHFAAGTSASPEGMAMVGERGPEMVSLPKGSQVAANGSAAFNQQTAQPAATGGSSASSAPPVVNVTVKLGDQELKQLVQSVEVKPYVNGKKSKLYDSMMTGVSQEIMKTA